MPPGPMNARFLRACRFASAGSLRSAPASRAAYAVEVEAGEGFGGLLRQPAELEQRLDHLVVTLVRQIGEHGVERRELAASHAVAHGQLGQLLRGYRHSERRRPGAHAIVDGRGIFRVAHGYSLPSKSNLSNPGFPLGGSSRAMTVVTGAVGSSTGWTSAYWSSQQLSLRPHVTG